MIIYKYLGLEGVVPTIKNNNVILKTPLEYNDPLDCIFYVSGKEMQRAFNLFINYYVFEELYKGLIVEKNELILGKLNTAILRRNLLSAEKAIREKKRFKYMLDVSFYYSFAKFVNRKNDDDLREVFNSTVNKILDELRKAALLSCFSLKNDSILMWSHYADKHQGACVEFEIDDNNFRKVRYSRKKPCFKLTKALEIALGHDFINEEVDYENENYLFAVEPIFVKYKGWKYEKEVRCAFSSKKSNPSIYEDLDNKKNKRWFLGMPKIKAIYIGYNATDSLVDDIKKCCGDIPLMKMKNPKDYDLVAEPLD